MNHEQCRGERKKIQDVKGFLALNAGFDDDDIYESRNIGRRDKWVGGLVM